MTLGPYLEILSFSSGAFPYYSAGGRVITIIHYQLKGQGSSTELIFHVVKVDPLSAQSCRRPLL